MSAKKPQASDTESTAKTKAPARRSGVRETVESIVIAFVLAFLFRTFEAEAFVIPTGSMAPTLMGQHKDLECPRCGFPYQVNASEESDEGGQRPTQVTHSVCPNCRFVANLVDANRRPIEKSYRGDQILVAKFPYALGDPKRYDVAVFKYPQAAKVNYIKRVVGLPGERLMLRGGDVYSRPLNPEDALAAEYKIQRKPPEKVRAMLQLVYDNDYVVPEMIELGWPARWQADDPSLPAAWTPDEGYKTYSTAGAADSERWLRYRHTPPLQSDWDDLTHIAARGGKLPPEYRERIDPQLISDFYGYNTNMPQGGGEREYLGDHWVGDLAVECELTSESAEGAVTLELVEAGHVYRCHIDLATGQLTLLTDADENFSPTASTDVRGAGSHRILFANVDEQLFVWIDDDLVEFDVSTELPPKVDPRPTARDLAPVGIASRGAKARVGKLRVWRDIYYMAATVGSDMYDYISPSDRQELLRDVSLWRNVNFRQREFDLAEDQFLMLGDNSPRSKDSRLWGGDEYYVERRLLTGKAIFIHWPHGLDYIPGLNIPFPVFPNFPRMGFIR